MPNSLQTRRRRRLNAKMIRYIKARGEKYFVGSLSAYSASPQVPGDVSRMSCVIRKSSGNAVFRNRIKRIVHKAFQDAVPRFLNRRWLLFEVPPGRLAVSLKQFKHSLASILNRF